MRVVPIVVGLALASACGGSVVDPSPNEGTPIQTPPATALDASVPPEAPARGADAGVTEGDAISSDAACEYPLRGFSLPDLDTPCFDGPTARQVLALLSPSYASTFVPSGPPFGTTWTGSLAPSPLAMTFTYEAGTVTCKPQLPDCDPTPDDPDRVCCPLASYGSLSVEVAATFQTSDGAFDEPLSATATVAWFAPGSVTWTATLPARDLHGTYPPMFGATETFDFQGALAPSASLSGTVVETKGALMGGGGTWGP